VKPHKLLHPSQTRWLSLLAVVRRLLEQMPALKLFFGQASCSNLRAAERINKLLSDPTTNLYLEFLEYALPIFDDLNKEMQSEKSKLHVLYARNEACYRSILDFYIYREYLEKTDIASVQYRDPKNFKALKDVYLRGKVSVDLAKEDCKLSQEEIRALRTRCLNFLVESAHQIYKRFPFQKCGAIKQLSDIAPKSVLSKQVGSLGPLVGKFPNLLDKVHINELDREWRLLRNTDLTGAPEDLREFWLYVGSLRKGDDASMFPILVAFIRKLLCLPHSSAAVESFLS
ncbi:unnamed protein product, partial [Ixodes hexagonus]